MIVAHGFPLNLKNLRKILRETLKTLKGSKAFVDKECKGFEP
jgi:hypothetical protein